VPELPDDLLLACSLDDAQLVERRSAWRSVAESALIETRRRPDGFTSLYRGDEEVAEALRGLVLAERECCPGIGWELDRAGDAIRLDVTYERA
jgi:hypothetical protein